MQCISITRALLVRIVFTLHALTCIILVQRFSDGSQIWFLTLTLSGLFMETLVIIIRRRGQEWMWFSPSIFFYLLSVVPAIWFMELTLINNISEHCQSKNVSNRTINGTDNSCSFNKNYYQISIKIGTVKVISLDSTAQVLEQFLLLLLIMGRWFMPKGKMSRAQLSQILLIYIGVAADIVELFEAFKEEAVRHSKLLTILVLTVWSISLLQFCFILVSKPHKHSHRKSNKQSNSSKDVTWRSNGNTPCLSMISLKTNSKHCYKCKALQWAFSLDVLGILMPLLLQDTPFLILRLYFIIEHKIVSYTNTFFTAKNSLVILLLVYRLIVIQMESRKKTANLSPLSSTINVIHNLDRLQSNSIISTPKLPHPHQNQNHFLKQPKIVEPVVNENQIDKSVVIHFSKSLNDIPITSTIQPKYQKQTPGTWRPTKLVETNSSGHKTLKDIKYNLPNNNNFSNNEIDIENSIKMLQEMIADLS